MKLHASYSIDRSFIGPIWKKGRWWYEGKSYDSLRHLKTRSLFKLEKALVNVMAEEIRKEIDREFLEDLKRFEEET